MTKIKVLIDGYYLRKPRGLGRYIKELLYNLSLYPRNEVQIFVLVPDDINNEYLIQGKNITYIFSKGTIQPIWEQCLIPITVRKYKIDVVFHPYNTSCILMNFYLKNVKRIVTIHDLMFLDSNHKSANLYQKLGNIYRKICVKFLSKQATIISVSNKTKKEIAQKINRESTVIYSTVDKFYNDFYRSKNKVLDIIPNEPYFLHVGGSSPHKNTIRVIEAFKKSNVYKHYKLLIVGLGKKGKIQELYKDDRVEFLDWITDLEMASLYKNACALIFPSLNEGYGLPIVEAIKFNCPVITSNIEPMSEISMGSSLLVNPYDIDEIYKALENITDKEMRNRLQLKQKSVSNIFSSEVYAKKLYDLIINGL